MLSWLTLKGVYDLNIIKGSAIWIFLVPALVKIFNVVNISESINASDVFFNSYVLFCLYFSALSFFIGSILFKVRCPSLNKDIKGYDAFLSKGMSIYNISGYINELGKRDAILYKNILIKEVFFAKPDDIDNDKTFTIERADKKLCYTFHKDDLNIVFWSLYVFSSKTHKVSQFFCWFFLFLGFSGLLLVLLKNLLAVIDFMKVALA